jgi:hypothetical protein
VLDLLAQLGVAGFDLGAQDRDLPIEVVEAFFRRSSVQLCRANASMLRL